MLRTILCLLTFFGCFSCSVAQEVAKDTKKDAMTAAQLQEWAKEKKLDSITLGAGCFWCTEAAFQQINGVEKVVSGYSNGHVENPTYEQICTKKTGHVEVAQIFYDPKVVKLEQILAVFFAIHDSTSMDRQGADAGPQYRSAIFFHNDQQKAIAEKCMAIAGEALAPQKVVTVLDPLQSFYPAEDYHQNYYKNNPKNGYCVAVVREKVLKVRKAFGDLLNAEAKSAAVEQPK